MSQRREEEGRRAGISGWSGPSSRSVKGSASRSIQASIPEGGDYAGQLEVTLPAEKRGKVMAIIKSLEPEGAEDIDVAMEQEDRYPTWTLWWD